MSACTNPNHHADAWWEADNHGIPLCKVCQVCRGEKLKGYSASVLDEEQLEASGRAPAPDAESYEERAAAYGESIEGDDQ